MSRLLHRIAHGRAEPGEGTWGEVPPEDDFEVTWPDATRRKITDQPHGPSPLAPSSGAEAAIEGPPGVRIEEPPAPEPEEPPAPEPEETPPPEPAADGPSPDLSGWRRRGQARRRLRYLRGARELQLRDLGGFVLDLYRFGEQRDDLVRAKLDAIIAADKERHALEALLADRRPRHEVRQPGVGGTCSGCGELHASHARFCARCGLELVEGGVEAPAASAAAKP